MSSAYRVLQGFLIAGLWFVSTAPRRVRHRKALQAILLVSLVVSAAVFHRIYEAGLGDITVLLLLAPLVLMTVIVHEVSHGWVALQLGDPTAKERGRLTFNPLKHISFKWTVLFPITTLYLFGVGLIMPKPVPVNARNFENPKTDIIWVGLAGPAVNIALMLFFAVILGSGIVPNGGAGFFVRQLLTVLIIVNMVLAMFNLIPIPPLDGSRLLTGLLPARHRHFLMRVEILGLLFIFAMVIGTKLSVGIEEVLRPPIKFVWEMLGLDRNELHRLLDGPHP